MCTSSIHRSFSLKAFKDVRFCPIFQNPQVDPFYNDPFFNDPFSRPKGEKPPVRQFQQQEEPQEQDDYRGVRGTFKEFAETTTLHGVPHLVSNILELVKHNWILH